MLCSACQKENSSGTKFCKHCGLPLTGEYKTCANGHNYDSSKGVCPYCPKQDFGKTQMDVKSGKTDMGTSSRADKTVIESSAPTLTPSSSRSDKTIIMTGNAAASPSVPASPVHSRKLVGWLVTFDINPNGTDYRLFEGRTKIGKNAPCDIVLNQNGVSDDHALILYRDGKIVIQDMLSTNGTFVNGESIDDKKNLKDSDEVRIGVVTLKLKVI